MSPPTRSIRRVLVANRGEIAVRVMRTCKERGLSTVAVYSDADRLAPHVLMADAAVHIGPAPSAQSYLVIDKIIEACKQTGADAVHPGYGFLSENDDFAEACLAHGITFIGPSADSMRKMGSKTEARKTVSAAGTPVVPGDNGPEGNGFPNAEMALASAKKIGFPVLLKAAAGGGGKGMRLVHTEAELAPAFEGAVREATSAFGDGTVYIEKAILKPRHIEIQVFGDTHGNIVHLGERDCSIQRRHQKVIEEAPSPVVSPELRAQMGAAAIAAAKAVSYVGAGTCEFIADAQGNLFFLEVNARLQVEHPVTEMVTGLDLVELQLRVAAGEKLPDLSQVTRSGHAIEARVYAEDPSKGFIPKPGPIDELVWASGAGEVQSRTLRVESGVAAGSKITPYYDPMIAKVDAWGETRDAAIAELDRALEGTTIAPATTNLSFLRKVLGSEEFRAGAYDTRFAEILAKRA